MVGAIGVAASGALFAWLSMEADRGASDRLETQLSSIVDSTEESLDQVANKLVSLSGLFRASILVTPDEFRTFTGDVGLAPGMIAIGYIARVDDDEVDRFRGLFQTQSGDPIEVFELDEEGDRRELGDRPYHYLVQYVTPEETVGGLVGYDVASDPLVADQLEAAVRTGELTVTPFFRLFPEPSAESAAMLLAVAKPSGDDPDSLVGAIIDVADLVATNIPAGVAAHVEVEYADGQVPPDGGTVSDVLEYGGRVWGLSIEALPGSPFAPDRSGPYAVLAIGLLASALGSLLVIIMRQRLEASTALAAAEQATEAKNRFIASVSHELRTPLTAVLGFAEILKKPHTMTPEEQAGVMKVIADEGTALAHLIDDLLVAARREIGQLSVVKTPVSMRAEAETVAAVSGIGPRLRVIPSQGGNEVADCDPTRVRQIVRNLVENARRYGGGTIVVEIFPGEEQVTLEVRDDGEGLPADIGDRPFQPYERFGEVAGVTESLGLGLTVSAQLAVLMDGRLRHERRDGWTVFSLTLPAAVATDLQVLEESSTLTSS